MISMHAFLLIQSLSVKFLVLLGLECLDKTILISNQQMDKNSSKKDKIEIHDTKFLSMNVRVQNKD